MVAFVPLFSLKSLDVLDDTVDELHGIDMLHLTTLLLVRDCG